jgi:GalNAc-alpha-(1->4)-GalNAc-alpha-(1->3)-diNAcBac-PP-undecaprenol alpha-1,4-N-acetyl-D-galactosaminyltransferase
LNKKIMFIMHQINYGGAAKIFTFLANGLSECGNKVEIYTFNGNELSYTINDTIKYFPEKKIYKNLLLKRVLPFIGIYKMINKNKPDIVISFLPNSNLYSIIASIFNKNKVVISERSDPFFEKGLLLKLKRYFFNFADGAVFQTNGAMDYYGKKLKAKSIVIPNPVTVKPTSPLPYYERNKEIAFVARFYIKQKRQDIMIKAFQRIVQIKPGINLVFYGDGDDMEEIKKMVLDIGLNDNVIFAGKVKNIETVLQKSMIYVSTSDYEGISNSLIEAMALGLPVIATDSSPGGARLLIKNMENGIIVPRGDIEKLADSILFLLNNPEYSDKLGKNAQKIIQTYCPEKIINSWNDYLDQVLCN